MKGFESFEPNSDWLSFVPITFPRRRLTDSIIECAAVVDSVVELYTVFEPSET